MKKGPLTPEQQLTVLSRIWGKTSGYVFLPYIRGTARTTEERRRGFSEGRAFPWPSGRNDILHHLHDHVGDDLYFTPGVFDGKRRIEQNLAPERALWADLDEADPRSCDQDYRPTIAWESSPGRYQGVWLMDCPKVGASWAGQENHRLTLYLGADKSGWDSTQLLRVPGRENHKPIYGDTPQPGQLLWDNGPRYQWCQFDDLPEVGIVDAQIELVDETLLEGIDRQGVWSRVKLKVSQRTREYLYSRTTDGADRSEVLWQIERELADAGCSIAEIIVIIRPSVWNKYTGRADELKRLKIEAAKAVSMKVDSLDGVGDVIRPEEPSWGNAWFHTPSPRPRWLVQDIWAEGACGFIAGAPKSYKSWLALDLALSVATGMPFLGQWPVKKQGPVLYLQEEDPVPLVKDRYRLVLEGKNPAYHPDGSITLAPPFPGGLYQTTVQDARNPLYGSPSVLFRPPQGDVPVDMQVQTGFIASDPAWQEWLEARVADHCFKLIVIDTLSTTAGDIDTDRAQELMVKVLKPLKTIAHKHQTAICVVHHNRKASNSDRAGQDMLGSTALHAWVDCALYARSKEGQAVVIDRESKATVDLRFTIAIPRMYESSIGQESQRQVWSPQVQEDNGRVDIPQETSTAGRRIAERLKVMGDRWLTEEEIIAVLGPKVLPQLTAAHTNGFMDQDSRGRWHVRACAT